MLQSRLKTIQFKIVLWSAFGLFLAAGITIIIAAYTLNKTATDAAEDHFLSLAREESEIIATEFNQAADITRALAQAFSIANQTSTLTREDVNAMLVSILLKNPEYVAVYTAWEKNAFDNKDAAYAGSSGYDDLGQFAPYWFLGEDGKPQVTPLEVNFGGFFDLFRANPYETILEPYSFDVGGEEILMTSLIVPIVWDDTFQGLVGVDLPLTFLQERADALDIYDGRGEMLIISNAGTIAAWTNNAEQLNESMSARYGDTMQDNLGHIQAGEEIFEQELGDIVTMWRPIQVGQTGTPWTISINAPTSVITEDANRLVMQLIAIGLILITATLVFLWFAASRIASPIKNITQVARSISKGNLDLEATGNQTDETGALAISFNQMVNQLKNTLENEQLQRERLQTTVEDYVAHTLQVGQGNLTGQITLQRGGNDQDDPLFVLGHNLNEMTTSLRDMIVQIRQASLDLSESSAEIQSSASQQMAGISEQEAAVTQTVATVEEVRTTVMQTAERAQVVSDTSQEALNVSREGQRAIFDSVEGMNVIQDRVESIAETILTLSERTQQISNIIETVTAIADQSKMLALNASIEAARAGEEGKGFSVVAMEVRQLAEQSREATGQIANILTEIQQATNMAVMATEEGSKGVENGVLLVEQAGKAIDDLAQAIDKSAQSATQIAASTHQQSNGMDQLAAAMLQIRQASTQSADSMRQTEQSIRDLLKMARDLSNAAARYDV